MASNKETRKVTEDGWNITETEFLEEAVEITFTKGQSRIMARVYWEDGCASARVFISDKDVTPAAFNMFGFQAGKADADGFHAITPSELAYLIKNY